MIQRLNNATRIPHTMSPRFLVAVFTSPPLADSTIYITPLYNTIVIDKTIVNLNIHFAILTISGACVVTAGTFQSPHNTCWQKSVSDREDHILSFCAWRSLLFIILPSNRHPCQKFHWSPTDSLRNSLPTALVVLQRSITVSWDFAVEKACSKRSSACVSR